MTFHGSFTRNQIKLFAQVPLDSVVQQQSSDLWVPLVHLVGELLGVGVVLADANEIDLELKRTVCFVS